MSQSNIHLPWLHEHLSDYDYQCMLLFELLFTLHIIKLMATFLSVFLFQRVWRRYYVIRMVTEQLHEDWELSINQPNINLTNQWISSNMLRPFLFFTSQPSSWYKAQQNKTIKSIFTCFKIILNSINSVGMHFVFPTHTCTFTFLLFAVQWMLELRSKCFCLFISRVVIFILLKTCSGFLNAGMS
jgi:hypothetical protein